MDRTGFPQLHVVTGAPGAGKSTLLRHLGAYPFATVDFDELLESDGSLLGIDIASPEASLAWPAYNRLWVKIATMLLRAGSPVLILCPLAPDEWTAATAHARNPPGAAWGRLDCDDADRRVRLAARGWTPEQIEEAVEDAEELRLAIGREFTTTGSSAADVAAAVADWVLNGAEKQSAQ
ncbi:hypothetical protein [Streptomyces sp. NPDC048644]|uniref:hypothetical protein n=1 Tax=Streptomyces sp. NPDC048644 TaxID=3365582 RepID=UPI0037183D54